MESNKINGKQICIIHFIRDTGGVAKMLTELANLQVSKGIKVIVAHTSLTEGLRSMFSNKVDFIEIQPKYLPPMFLGLEINKVYLDIKNKYPNFVHIVHAHNIATIGLFSDINNIPLVCTIHGLSWFGDMSLRKKISKYLTFKRIKNLTTQDNIEIVAVSNTTANYYKEGMRSDGIKVVYNGIRIVNAKKKNEKFTFGFVGDISDSKGWNVVLEAFNHLEFNMRNSINFLVAGRPLSYSHEEIENQLKKLEMGDSAKYMGFVTDAYRTVMPNVDVLILPSISEGLPMAIIEAQSIGIPVIATGVGGIPEIINDQNNGLIIERDSESLSKAMLKVFKNAEYYKTLSTNSLVTFEKKFSSEIMFNKYLNIYQHLINKFNDKD